MGTLRIKLIYLMEFIMIAMIWVWLLEFGQIAVAGRIFLRIITELDPLSYCTEMYTISNSLLLAKYEVIT